MSYPAFSDLYGLMDRGDVILAGIKIALSVENCYGPMQEFLLEQPSQDSQQKHRAMRMLIFMHLWFHGAVQDRRKVVQWLRECNYLLPVDRELRLFALCSMAYGIGSVHRELGMVSNVKIDLIVAAVMSVTLQFQDGDIASFAGIPQTLNQVQDYLVSKLNCSSAKLLSSFQLLSTDVSKMSNTIVARLLESFAQAICPKALKLISSDRFIVTKSIWYDDPYILIVMKCCQPLFAHFHEQLCPTALTFDGMLENLCSHDSDLKNLNLETRHQIFGSSQQKQFSLLDSFIPETMTREQVGMGSRTLYQSIHEQVSCALIRGEFVALDSDFKIPKHLAIVI